MKSDEDVKVPPSPSIRQMISAEAPALFAKACEMFIAELTHRAWFHTEENKRRTLQKSDISQAVGKTDIFDFLIDIVPKEDAAQRPVFFSLPEVGHTPAARGTLPPPNAHSAR
jgi:nuclear transcription factor Y gamma